MTSSVVFHTECEEEHHFTQADFHGPRRFPQDGNKATTRKWSFIGPLLPGQHLMNPLPSYAEWGTSP
jgi:hypothetical protein